MFKLFPRIINKELIVNILEINFRDLIVLFTIMKFFCEKIKYYLLEKLSKTILHLDVFRLSFFESNFFLFENLQQID